jgi:hypothetical protein
MVDGSVVNDEIREDANATILCCLGKLHEIAKVTVARVDIVVVANIIAMISARRRKERLQPDTIHVQSNEIVQFARETQEIANTIAVSIRERLQVNRVHDRILMPKTFHVAPLRGRRAIRGIARLSLESSGSRVTHFTMPFCV